MTKDGCGKHRHRSKLDALAAARSAWRVPRSLPGLQPYAYECTAGCVAAEGSVAWHWSRGLRKRRRGR